MNLTEARDLANSLMAEHGLAGTWTFEFDNAKSRLGHCVHTYKRITVSRHMAGAATTDDVHQTMLHEIAHALVGPNLGHGDVWKAKAASIGYVGARTAVNPYKRPAKIGVQSVIVDTNYVARVGDTVRLRSGIVGRVTKVLRSRSQVLCEDGQLWSVPFGLLKQITETENTPAIPARVPRKRSGETVTFRAGKGYIGKTATILSVGSSRYKVKVDGTSTVLFAPFELVS